MSALARFSNPSIYNLFPAFLTILVTCSHQFILFWIIAPRIRAEFSKARKILSKQACVILYKAMILPLFDYCCVIWDGCGKTNQQYLEKLQRRAAEIIEGHRVNQTDLIHIISWPSLGLRRVYHICLLVHKCLNNMAPEYLLDEFHRSGEFHTSQRLTLPPPLLQELLNIKVPSG